MAKDIEMSTKYDPSQVEPGRYGQWVNDGLFKRRQKGQALFNRDPASERNRQASLGPCLGHDSARHADQAKTHARV